MAAEHSLLLETLREIVTMLSDKSVASLIKSKDLDATVEDFCNLVKAYGTSQGLDAFEEGSSETLETNSKPNQSTSCYFQRAQLNRIKEVRLCCRH